MSCSHGAYSGDVCGLSAGANQAIAALALTDVLARASEDTVVSYATRTLLLDRIDASAAGSGQPCMIGIRSGVQRRDAGFL